MRIRRSLAAVFLSAAVIISGCGKKDDPSQDTVSPEASEIADRYFSGDADSFTSWKDIPRDKVIAYVENSQDSDYFNITFGEFFSEYMYYLVSYQISDDMSEENRDQCESFRDNIITFLTFERQYIYAGKTEYGITPETLTEEQLNEVISSAENVRRDWSSNFYTSVSAELGDKATEAEITAVCDDVLRAILKKCGLTENIFYQWELNKCLEDLIIMEIEKKSAVTDEDVQAVLDSLVTEAKEAAENDPSGYIGTPSYTAVYIPEGTRRASYILLSFTEEERSAIYDAKADGDTDRMNELIEAAYNDEMKKKANDVAAVLADGGDPAKLCDEYGGNSEEQLILKNSVLQPVKFIETLYSLPKPGEISDPVLTEDGVYFIIYAGDAAVDKEETDNLREHIRADLESDAKISAQNKEYNRWLEEYRYTVDYETLMIDAQNNILSGIDTSLQ